MYRLFSPRANYWVKTLSKFVSAQLIVQALGFASGILLIRTLDKQEYAYFTLANSMQGTINVLANSGVSSALFSIGGKIWQDPHRFGELIATAMQVRRYLAVIAIAIITPVMMWMLLKNGASIQYSLLLVVGILIELHFYLSDGVMRIVPSLRSQFNRLQNLDLIFAVSRVFLLLVSSLALLNAAIAVFASTIASGLKNNFLWNYTKNTVDVEAPVNKEYKQEILKLVKYHAPNSIFYCFQGQLTILLISIFGNTENIAEVGALARLSVIFVLINSVINNIILPSFARCQTPSKFIKDYGKILLALSFICFAFMLVIYFYPQSFLTLLGNKYQHLINELFFIALLSVAQFLSRFLWMINSTKGWIKQAWLFVPSIILTQIVSLLFLDLSTIQGVIVFSLYATIPAFIINFYMTYYGLRQWKAQLK